MSTLRQAAQVQQGEVRFLVHATITDSTNVLLPSKPKVEVDVYFGNQFFMDRTSSFSSFYYKPFLPRIISPLNITETMFDIGLTGGAVKQTIGTIQLSNADGELDYLLEYSWDKKPISVYMLRDISPDDTFGDHHLIFGGLTLGVSATRDTIDIVVSTKISELDSEFPPNRYGGTGGNDGTSNLAGKVKPITLGQVYNVPAVLVDPSNRVYQVHDGSIDSLAVYENGVQLTLGSGNDYTADMTNGRFTLNSTRDGVITADVENTIPYTSSIPGGVDNGAGVILLELLSNYAGLTNTTDYLQTPFNNPDPNAYEHGAYFDSPTTILDACNLFLKSIGGLLTTSGSTPITLDIVEFPTVNPLSLSADPITDDEIIDIEIMPTAKFSGANVVVKYRKNYRPLLDSEVESTVSASVKDFLIREWRSVFGAIISVTWGTGYSTLRDVEIETTIQNEADANTEKTRISNFYTRDAQIYRVRMKSNPLYLKVGGAVELKSSRFGLTDSNGDGYPMLILSKFDDLEANEVTLEVMGEND